MTTHVSEYATREPAAGGGVLLDVVSAGVLLDVMAACIAVVELDVVGAGVVLLLLEVVGASFVLLLLLDVVVVELDDVGVGMAVVLMMAEVVGAEVVVVLLEDVGTGVVVVELDDVGVGMAVVVVVLLDVVGTAVLVLGHGIPTARLHSTDSVAGSGAPADPPHIAASCSEIFPASKRRSQLQAAARRWRVKKRAVIRPILPSAVRNTVSVPGVGHEAGYHKQLVRLSAACAQW